MRSFLKWLRDGCVYTVVLSAPLFLFAYFSANLSGISIGQYVLLLTAGMLLSAAQRLLALRLPVAVRLVLHFFATVVSVTVPAAIGGKMTFRATFFILFFAYAALYAAVSALTLALLSRKSRKTGKRYSFQKEQPEYKPLYK